MSVIFIISFILFALGLVCSTFSSFLKWAVRFSSPLAYPSCIWGHNESSFGPIVEVQSCSLSLLASRLLGHDNGFTTPFFCLEVGNAKKHEILPWTRLIMAMLSSMGVSGAELLESRAWHRWCKLQGLDQEWVAGSLRQNSPCSVIWCYSSPVFCSFISLALPEILWTPLLLKLSGLHFLGNEEALLIYSFKKKKHFFFFYSSMCQMTHLLYLIITDSKVCSYIFGHSYLMSIFLSYCKTHTRVHALEHTHIFWLIIPSVLNILQIFLLL